MKFKDLFLIILFMINLTTTSFAQIQKYIFNVRYGSITKQAKMLVKQRNKYTEVIWTNGNNEKQISNFMGKTKLLNTKYFNPEGKEILSVIYDYNNEKINISGMKNSVLPLKGETFESASLFYLFSYIYPTTSKGINFNLLQSKNNRMVKMYLKQIGTETIDIGGEKIQAFKYEMGLKNFLASMFWPHKYYYWYSTDDRKFLKYQGMGPDGKNIETIELIYYSEKD